MNKLKKSLLALAIAPSLLNSQTLSAQGFELEEVVVTARKRSENLQQLPDSITVFSAQTIEDARISKIQDFAELTPNLDVFDNFRPNLAYVSIRGLITPQVGEPPLAFVADGVTVPNIEFINQGLQDIERIEVLRGPQGALYGKNAIGGAINIVTKQPSNEHEGAIQASWAEGDDKRLSLSSSGALVEDSLYYRISVFHQDRDGLIDDRFLNQAVDFSEQTAWQGLLRYEPSERTSIDLRASYSEGDYGVGYYTVVNPSNQEDFSIEPAHNVVPEDNSRLSSVSLKIEHESDYGLWSLVAAHNKSTDDNFLDGDFSALVPDPANFGFRSAQQNVVEDEAQSLEIRLVSDDSSDLRWLFGAYYQQRERISRFTSYNDNDGNIRKSRASFSAADIGFVINDDQESSAWALFSQLNYDINESLELTAALRYDEETRESLVPENASASFAEKTFSELQPKLSLAWQLSEEFLAYTTYSHGFRSGGFNEYHPQIVRNFDKEVSDTFDLGFKSEWLDGRMTINAALFYIEQENAQFTGFNPNTFTLENVNVDEVEVKGLEVELNAQPIQGLKISAGAGYIDNEITAFARDTSLLGNTMPFVAKLNLNASISYEQALGNGLSLVYRVAANHKGETHYVLENIFPSDSYTFVDLSLRLESEDWSATVFVDNAGDEDATGSISNFGLPNGIRYRNQPRQAGIQLRYNF